jgi:hypothetical protein
MALFAADIPWPEHPRPDFQRSPWVNLNGQWAFDFDPQDAGEKEQWFAPGKHAFSKQITVPFPWESKLSGIGEKDYKGVAWYSREITLPDGEGWKGKDAWLIVGACDWEAKVWVNGKPAVGHVGGYLPFEVNLSQFGKPGEKVTVVIRAKDVTDDQQPTGKQIGWYTRTSGIWQTVYIEPRNKARIMGFRAETSVSKGEAKYLVDLSREAKSLMVRVTSPEGAFVPVEDTVDERDWEGLDGGGMDYLAHITIKLRQPQLWSPESPKLYPVVIELLKDGQVMDRVESYFGLREITVAKAPGRDYKYVYLNGKPIYLAGALHQSFHPDGIYQYPNDAVMRSDYELCKRIGINFLRIHIKIPVPRELYWADKLGVMIMQDMPNVWNNTGQARKWYEEMLRGAVARDFNHPAIYAWVDFNETWGLDHPGPYDAERQEWVAKIYKLTKELDPTRLVEDNSPCKYDHVVTDINSWHFYINDYAEAKKHIQEVVDKTHPGSTFNYIGGRKQAAAPLMNSEYGGISAGLGDQDISWCFKYLTNELRKHEKICGYIYTELSDIEWEHNGFVNYDRSPKEYGYESWFPEFSLASINSPDFVVIDAEPCIVLKSDEKRSIPVAISHWSDLAGEKLELRWFLHWQSRGERPKWNTVPAKWRPYAVTQQEPIEIGPPDDKHGVSGLGALLVEVLDAGRVIARNYVNVYNPVHRPRMQVYLSPDAPVALRCDPSDFSVWEWAGQPVPYTVGIAAEKVWGVGAGYVEYQFAIPEEAEVKNLREIMFDAEMSAKARDEKLDWPARKTPHDYPQTDKRKWPTDVRISINGVEVHRQTLPDDPADARGVLTHLHGFHPGSYGWPVRASLSGAALDGLRSQLDRDRKLTIRIEVPADAAHRGGLAIFGDQLGSSTFDPQCVLHFAGNHGLTMGTASDKPVAMNRLTARRKALIPTAEVGGHEWRFTMAAPPADWAAPGFNDSEWKKGKGGFGARGTPNAIIGTPWRRPEIWLRTEVNVDDPEAITAATWRLHHDEDLEIYVNGRKVLARPGFVAEYIDAPVESRPSEVFKPGRNIIAVHCRQTEGGQYIDLGLTVVTK